MFAKKMFTRIVQSMGLSKVTTRVYSDSCRLDVWKPEQVEAGGFSCSGPINEGSGLLLGVYEEDASTGQAVCFTKGGATFNHMVDGQLVQMLKDLGPLPKLGELRVFPKLESTFGQVVVSGLGPNSTGYDKTEQRDEFKENIRKAVGLGIRYLQHMKTPKIYIEGFEDAETTAESAFLALWENQNLRAPTQREVFIPDVNLYLDCDYQKWRIGVEKAEAQNFARKLMEMPANLLTPRGFANDVVKTLCKTSVNVTLRGAEWLKEQNMNAFLANTQGSPQPPLLLEMSYYGCDSAIPPIVLIGKGLTFNSGGLCIKSCEEMKHMRGDMSGAAIVAAVFKALSNLRLPINVRGLIPLGENMPGGSAAKPRDIVKTKSGKSILISPRDFNGTLMLADTLCYAQNFKPKYVVTLASLSKEFTTGFHLTSSAVYTKNEKLWQLLKTSSIHTGDRLWKLPLWKMHEREVKDFSCADLSVHSKYFRRGIPTTTAALLNQFSCNPNWALIDILNTMYEDGKTPYLKEGMSGRPTRTILEFLGQVAYPPSDMLDQDYNQEAATKAEGEH